jgi:hypothetical protein
MRIGKRRLVKRSSREAKILEERVELGRELASSPTVTVTLRIPAQLNEWLDGYIHGMWPEKVRKQDLVTEGLRLLVARRGGPRKPCVSTDLLDDEISS